ncbi:MAG TPA: F0F1 ATP synthase subunit A [Candidatus Paceibacterota bacterium]
MEEAVEQVGKVMPEISIKAETIFHIGNFAVSNSLFLGVIAMILVVLVALLIRTQIKTVPGRIQGFIELALDELLTLMDSVLGTRERSLTYLPLIATVFLFVTLSNWLGLLPLIGPLIVGHVPLLRAPTSDLNFTIGLAIIAVLSVNLLGVAAIGLGKHMGKFFYNPFRHPIMAFVGILELISEFVKIISFSFRLFGNIFAGEVLLVIIAAIVPYWASFVAPLPFLFLEVFVGMIQGFIFAMLTLVFVGMSTVAHAEH